MPDCAVNIDVVIRPNPVTTLNLTDQVCLLRQSKQMVPCGSVAHAYTRMIEQSHGLKCEVYVQYI